MRNVIHSTRTHTALSPRERTALIQSTWSNAERRRRRELAAFLQKRLAWHLALDTAKHHDASQAVHA